MRPQIKRILLTGLIALVLIPVILGAAFLASLGPAESAVRGSLIEALEYE